MRNFGLDYIPPRFKVVKDAEKCIGCNRCIHECSHGVFNLEEKSGRLLIDEFSCVNCQRCAAFCPTGALTIARNPISVEVSSSNWSQQLLFETIRASGSGAVLLSSLGAQGSYPVYFDRLVINASQVTNPPIDPLREPMETDVFLGNRGETLKRKEDGSLLINHSSMLHLSLPVLFSAMSYGSISYNAHKALASAAEELGTLYNTGEGGLHEDLYRYGSNTIVQVASGRFGVHSRYLEIGSAIEIKMGQGAKPGIGGHLPGTKIFGEVARTRMIPEYTDAISPAPHHDIYSIEDLRTLVQALKEATGYSKPVIVKVACVNNISSIASGIARSGADIIALDGYRGGTGAAPTRLRDNVGIPLELAIASVDSRLREEGIRDKVSLIAGGSIRSSADVIKALCLGADACYIATSALMAMGCHLCRSCSSGLCAWGIATQKQELVGRLDPEKAHKRLVNLMSSWKKEIMEFLGALGINSIEALIGNRAMLRGVGLNSKELEILGVAHAGE